MNIKPDIQNLIYLILLGDAEMTELISNDQAMRLNKYETDLLNLIVIDRNNVTNRKKHCLAYLYMRCTDRLLFPVKKEELTQWIDEIRGGRVRMSIPSDL